MKNIIFILTIVIIMIIMVGCNEKGLNGTYPGPVSSDTSKVSTEDVTLVKEIANNLAGISKETDFSVSYKENSSHPIKIEKTFLKGSNVADIDLSLSDDIKATLLISKTESVNSNESISYNIVNGFEYSSCVQDDGSFSYYWEKDGFYYSLFSFSEINKEELEAIIDGFTTTIKEGTL